MKRLILMLLAVAGMVGTVRATKTFYIYNNCNWRQMRVHQWNSSGGVAVNDVYLFTNYTTDNVDVATRIVDNKDKYYTVTLDDKNYTNFLIDLNYQDDGWEKTYDLSIADGVTEGSYYELKYVTGSGSYESQKMYNLKSNSVYAYNIYATTSTSWSYFYIYLWDTNTNSSVSGSNFRSLEVTASSSNYYEHTHYSYISSLGLIFADADKQTSNLNVYPGNNTFYNVSTESSISAYEAVTTNSSGYCTYVNRNAIKISGTGVTVYYATDDNDGTATAHAITASTVVAALTPMLIKGTASTTYNFEISSSEGTDYSETNVFKAGTGSALASTTDNKYNYILNGNAFYAASGKKVATDKAYLQLSAPASARVLDFPNEDKAGINVITVDGETEAYYNLNGQRIANPTKGLYIRGGKKMITK